MRARMVALYYRSMQVSWVEVAAFRVCVYDVFAGDVVSTRTEASSDARTLSCFEAPSMPQSARALDTALPSRVSPFRIDRIVNKQILQSTMRLALSMYHSSSAPFSTGVMILPP